MILNASAARSASCLTLPNDVALPISAIRISADNSLAVLLLMDSPLWVGVGVEITSYPEGESSIQRRHLPPPPQHPHDEPACYPAGGEHASRVAHELRDVRRGPLN